MSIESIGKILEEIDCLTDKTTEVRSIRRKKLEKLSNELKMYVSQDYEVHYDEKFMKITIFADEVFTPGIFCLLNKLNIDYVVDAWYKSSEHGICGIIPIIEINYGE